MKSLSAKKIIFVLCLLPLLFSCNDEAVPPGVIDTATLKDFLVEAYLLESYNSIAVSHNIDTINAFTAEAYSSLFQKYGFTQADYDTSMTYYMKHTQMLEDVYSRVTKELKLKQPKKE